MAIAFATSSLSGVTTSTSQLTRVLPCRSTLPTPIDLIHHTDGGMQNVTDNDFKRSIQDDTGVKPEAAEAFPDLEEDVRQSIR